MLEKLITFSLQQRTFVLIATFVLVVAGIVSVQNLPIEAFPDVEDVHVGIVTQVPGLAPEEVERVVTLAIEHGMSGVPNLAQMRSVSITGLSVVTLTFSEKTDDYFARQQVLEKLQAVNLPPEYQPTLAPLTTAVGEIYRFLVDAPKDMPQREVRAIQDWQIIPVLRTVPGVADITSFGGAVKEYQVKLDPYLLKKYNISIDQVNQALNNGSSNVGGGLMHRGDESLVVRSLGLYRSLDDIADTVILSSAGKPILVKDVGEVVIGNRFRSGIVAFNNQDDVIEGIVLMNKGQNPAKVIEALKAKVDEVNPKLPEGVKIRPFYDRTSLIHHTVHTVTENMIVGALLVVAILIIFLRNWRAALIVAAVIPLSLLFAFIVMDIRGVSANLISLGAVDFGIIIDSAVVLVEALMVKLSLAKVDEFPHHGTHSWRVTTLKNTAIEMGRPILFSKVIIILAFLPIFTFQRVEGKIFSPMAFTLSFALLGSILLTLTLVPALMSYLMKRTDMAEKHSTWMHNTQEWYRTVLLKVVKIRLPVILASVSLLVLSLVLSPLLGSEFLPKLDEGNIWLTISMPPSTGLEKTKEIERNIRNVLTSYKEINLVVSHVGRPDDGTDPKGPNNIEILADLKPKDTWHFSNKEALIADISAKIHQIPGIPTNFSQVIQDSVEEALSGVKGEISVKIFGSDLAVLEEKSDQVATVLNSIKGATDVAAIRISGNSELDITLDRQKLARYGMNVNDVNASVQTALGGTTTNTFYDGDRRFDVTLRLARDYRDSLDDINELPIALPNNAGTIPLGEVADVTIKQGASRVAREGVSRIVAIKANLIDRDQGSFVKEAMAKVKQQVKLPPGYTMTWGGQFENQQRSIKRLKVIVPLSLMLIFVVLFGAFRSVRNALLVLLMIPFSLIGGFAGLGLAGLHLSISAAVGFIALAGISVQNGVIMLEQFNHLLLEGRSVAEAVMEGAVVRLRPILMTALMAGLGLLPAALSHGIGSETQRPFAVVIVGGLITATIFTLLLLPLLFPLFSGEIKNKEASSE
ncbi:CusA/CzcA family heavy metal efflux RND transporter [Methylotenera oryzisoli]|uniref:CusA/CzcA family heavy metal efflux RND transporter n=1 Tax=Methylotenera oryzisoli TaxID=2080758 RepID=A0A4Y9VU51_9PROT|nr:CusA/CzcA family heavy metal efflux RND transporter [Methylotenera oryzisoli]TFW72645.1 CusA/CzcA family heavy metal efflux RND transporter [Methylotenera oryzisoli]